MDEEDYAAQASGWIAGQERIAALNLPVLPEDPEERAAMRAAGYDVLAECTSVTGGLAVIAVLSEDEASEQAVPAAELADALGVAPDKLRDAGFLAILRETPEGGRMLSGFRPLPDPGQG